MIDTLFTTFHGMVLYFIDTPKAAWIAFSAFSLFLFSVALVLAHFNKRHQFNVIDLTFYDSKGKLSDSKARLNGAFLVTAWAFVWLTLADKLTEWYVAAFLTAWVADRWNSRSAKAKMAAMQTETTDK